MTRWLRWMVVTLLVFAVRGARAQAAPPPPPPPAEESAPGPAEGGEAEGVEAGAEAAPDAEAELAARKEQAKERFFRGIEHVQNDEWDAALAEFLASRELFPGIASLKNAAIALRQLKRYADALEMYEELLEKFGDELRPEERKATDQAIAALRDKVGAIDVKTTPSGASVIVDGQERGTTPLKGPIRVNAGTRLLRLYKDGFLPHEASVLVAGGQTKEVTVALKALEKSGTLVVVESSGKEAEVVVDGSPVGETPWEGAVSPGTHSVALRSEGNLGTQPSEANITVDRTTRLSLKLVELDAELVVTPTPSNAVVHIDGVEVASGTWQGRLGSGQHKIEVVASGFLAYRRDVVLKKDQKEELKVVLERDLTDPMWRETVFVPHVYVDVSGGVVGGLGLGGAASKACGDGNCSEHDLPRGWLAGARAGYQLFGGLGVELFLGVISVQEQMTREVSAQADVAVRATDYLDRTELFGPMAALNASYTLFEKTPLTFRLWAGAALVSASYSNSATYAGTITNDSVAPPETLRFTQQGSIPEGDSQAVLPLVGPEVRFGYRFSRELAADIGIAAWYLFPPEDVRENADGNEVRQASLADYRGVFSDPRDPSSLDSARPGLLRLNQEAGLGATFLLAPTVSARYDF